MSLIEPAPPADCTAAFSATLPQFLTGAAGLIKESYLGVKPPVPDQSQIGIAPPRPQQVFVLDLNEAAHNPGRIDPPAAGWRIFAGSGQNSTVMGRMMQIPPSLTWKLTGVFYGVRVAQALDASQNLGVLPAVTKSDYVLRVLAVPGLNLEAFWLVAQSPATADLVIPFPAATAQPIPTLMGVNPYKMVTFLAIIRPLAASMLSMASGYGG
jgi:hypothetical protein